MNNNPVLARSILWSFIFFAFVSWPAALQAGWPTTPDSALFVDFGLYPYLAVDEHDQSITVVYIAEANRLLAKKYDRYGDPLWGGNAVVLADTTRLFGVDLSNLGNQWGAVVSDDSGGAIVCWEDFRHASFDGGLPLNNEIYLQRVDVNGQVRYGTNGRRISTPASEGWHELGDMKPDYHGGFVVGYYGDTTMYAGALKRFNINGNLMWERYFREGFNLDVNATDIDGNIFVSYGGAFGQPNRRMKLNLNGDFLWPDTLDGKIPGSKLYRGGGAFSDGQGGAIGVGDLRLKINRVDSTGQYVFGPNWIDLGGGQQVIIGYAPDGVGGIYVAWINNGSRLQRVTANGSISFIQGGLIIVPDSLSGFNFIVPDEENGVVFLGVDKRNQPINSLYAQRVDSTGQLLWDSTGIEFHSSSQNLFFANSARSFYPDKRGGAVYVWVQQAAGFGARVMLKQISHNGILGEVITSLQEKRNGAKKFKDITLNSIFPNPFNGLTTIEFSINESGHVRVEVYDILGKMINTLIDHRLYPNTYRVKWNGTSNSGESVNSGIYFCRLSVDTKNAIIQKLVFIK